MTDSLKLEFGEVCSVHKKHVRLLTRKLTRYRRSLAIGRLATFFGDGTYGQKVPESLKALGIEQVVISPQSPWQNGYCERVVGSISRICLDHMIVLTWKHLRCVLKEYFAYYHESRTHLGWNRYAIPQGDGEKDSPDSRIVQNRNVGNVLNTPVLGGLHHRYYREAA